MKKFRLTKAEIVSDLRKVARALNHSPSSVEYRRLGSYDVRTVQRKFNVSWSRIINSAGLCYSPRTSGRIACTEELKRDLLRVARELDHPPARKDYQTHGQFDAETIRRRSGKVRWEDAVAALTGLDREQIKQQQARGGCYRTTQDEAGINTHQLCLRVGGKWIDVLKAADIDLQNRNQRAILLTTPTERLVEDIVAIARRLGKVPKAREYEAYGQYSHLALRGRLGGWREVKKLVTHKLSARPRELSNAPYSHASQSLLSVESAVKSFFTPTRLKLTANNASANCD